MYIGIILAGIFAAGLVKNPWPLAIALAAIPVAWYWNKHGSPLTALMSWWRKSPATPTTSSPPTKKKWAQRVPWKTLTALFFALFFFQYPRDIILSWIRNPAITNPITGTEISRSVIVRAFDDFDVCDLEPNHRYTFVKATTSHRNSDPKDDNKLFPRRNKGDGEVTWGSVDGRVSMEPEKLPYKDGNYHFGILVNDQPPGRSIESDAKGCVKGSFNTNIARYFEVPDPFGMAFVFRGQ